MEKYSYTKISTYESCPSKYQKRYIEGITTKTKARPLALGSCMASGLAAFRATGNAEKAREAFIKTWEKEGKILSISSEDDPMRSVERGLTILNEYTKFYPSDPTDTIQPEIKFEEEVAPNIIFRGRIDGVIRVGTDTAIDEDKTASRLGDFYFKQLRSSYQILWYLWVAKRLGLFNIEGTRVPKCLINVLYIHAKNLRFERQLIIKTTRQVDASFPIMMDWIKQIQVATEMNLFPKADNEMCQKYGGCEYLPLKYAEGRIRESLLKNEYNVKSLNEENQT
jgi:hypothetical protein